MASLNVDIHARQQHRLIVDNVLGTKDQTNEPFLSRYAKRLARYNQSHKAHH